MNRLLAVGDRVPATFKVVTDWIDRQLNSGTLAKNLLPLIEPFLNQIDRVPTKVQGTIVNLMRRLAPYLPADDRKDMRALVEQQKSSFDPAHMDDIRPLILALSPEDYGVLSDGGITIRRREQPGSSGT